MIRTRHLILLASSSIIGDIRTLQKSGLASLALLYCDFRDDRKKDVRGLLTSLLVQLGDKSDVYSTILSDFYVTHGRGSQHGGDGEPLECLKNMLKLSGQATVYIAIDVIDECPMTGLPSPREEVLELVEEFVNLHVSNLRICVTSRPEADIVSALGRLAFRSVSLHMARADKFRTLLNISSSKSRRTLKCEHGGLPIKNSSSMCSRRELMVMASKELIPYYSRLSLTTKIMM